MSVKKLRGTSLEVEAADNLALEFKQYQKKEEMKEMERQREEIEATKARNALGMLRYYSIFSDLMCVLILRTFSRVCSCV